MTPFAAEPISGIAECERLLCEHLAEAVQAFGSRALGIVDLPALASDRRIVVAQVRAAAVLLWAMNVEAAGLPGVVDALSEASRRGDFAFDVATTNRLAEYWRARGERFSAEEREAIYQRLFGAESGFPVEWRRLLDALLHLANAPRDVGDQGLVMRIAVCATDLGEGLSSRAAGIVGFAGREIVAHVRGAVALLREPGIAQTLGNSSPWALIRQHSARLLGYAIEPSVHIERAHAGLDILSWIAAHGRVLEQGSLRLKRDDPVVLSALRWSAVDEIAAPTVDVRSVGSGSALRAVLATRQGAAA